MRRRGFLFAAGATGLIPMARALACEPAHRINPLKIGHADRFRSIDPAFAYGVSAVITRNIFPALCERFPKPSGGFGISKRVARSWSFSQDGTGKKKRLILKLHPGLKWYGGRPLTAADVAASYHRQLDLEDIGHATTVSDLIKSVTVISETELEFLAKEPIDDENEFALEVLAGFRGTVLPETIALAFPIDEDTIGLYGKLSPSDLQTNDFHMHGNRFTVANFTKDAVTALACFDGHGSGPNFRNVEFHHNPDHEALVQALLEGRLHIIGPFNAPATSRSLQNAASKDGNITVSTQAICANYCAGVNVRAIDKNQREEVQNQIAGAAHYIGTELAANLALQSANLLTPSRSFIPAAITGTDFKPVERGLRPPKSSIATLSLGFRGSDPLAETLAFSLKRALSERGIDLQVRAEAETYVAEQGPDIFLYRSVSRTGTRRSMLDHVMRAIPDDAEDPLRELASLGNQEAYFDKENTVLSDGSSAIIPLADVNVVYATSNDLNLAAALEPDGTLGELHRVDTL